MSILNPASIELAVFRKKRNRLSVDLQEMQKEVQRKREITKVFR